MRSEKVTFPGSAGTPLAGRLDLPDAQPQAFALFAHCFHLQQGRARRVEDPASSDWARHRGAPLRLHRSRRLRRRLRQHQLHVERGRPGQRGGLPALQPRGPHDPGRPLLDEGRHEIEETGEAEICLAARPFRIRKQFLDDISNQPQVDRIRRLGAALLVMHSPSDETVGIDNARIIFDAARHPKSFVSLDGADHLLTRAADARFAASMLASWASRYLDEGVLPTAEATNPSADEVKQGLVVVSEHGRGPYGQRITVGRHLLSADEPAPVGHDTGPSRSRTGLPDPALRRRPGLSLG